MIEAGLSLYRGNRTDTMEVTQVDIGIHISVEVSATEYVDTFEFVFDTVRGWAHEIIRGARLREEAKGDDCGRYRWR